MLALLTEPIDVRLIEESDWWDPWLVPLAIILAGLIAAGLTWLVHRQSLEAEERRLNKRFRHERQMRERDATRASVDDVVALITRINDSLANFASRVVMLEQARAEFDDAADSMSEEELNAVGSRLVEAQARVTEALSPAFETVTEGLAAHLRLQMRFPDGHPIVVTFADWHQAIERWFASVRRGGTQSRTPEQRQESDELARDITNALTKFVEAVREWLHTIDDDELHPPEEPRRFWARLAPIRRHRDGD